MTTENEPEVASADPEDDHYDPEEPVLFEDVVRLGWRDPDALFNLGAVIVLALVAITTAWSGYQTSRFSGLASDAGSAASALRTSAYHAESAANDKLIIDLTVFTTWLEAYSVGNRDLSDFFQDRMRSEFLPAFRAWVATDPINNDNAPNSPFAMPEYVLADQVRADELMAQAETKTEEQAVYNARGDGFLFVSVLLALVLFFVTMAQRFETPKYRFIVAAMGLVILFWALVQMGRLTFS